MLPENNENNQKGLIGVGPLAFCKPESVPLINSHHVPSVDFHEQLNALLESIRHFFSSTFFG